MWQLAKRAEGGFALTVNTMVDGDRPERLKVVMTIQE